MAIVIKADVSMSGQIKIAYAGSYTLGTADALIPDELAGQIKTKIESITGVDSATVRCSILDLVEVDT